MRNIQFVVASGSPPDQWNDPAGNASHIDAVRFKDVRIAGEKMVTAAKSARILIVDDQRDQCELLARLLRWYGHETHCRFDAQEALQWLDGNAADLLILDVMMPGMDGIELLRTLRQRPPTRDLPVVMYSAKSDPATRRQAADAGASDYWVKSMTGVDEIIQRLQGLLGF